MSLIQGMALVNIVKAQIVTEEETPVTFEFETANDASVDPEVDEGEEQILRVKNKIIATNKTEDIAYGYELVLTDNTLIPEVLAIVDGGSLRFDEVETEQVLGYDGPVSGLTVSRTLFTLNLFTEEKDADGDTLQYAKLSFMHCKGKPVSWALKDGEFFVPEFTITARPKTGEKAITVDFMDTLPV